MKKFNILLLAVIASVGTIKAQVWTGSTTGTETADPVRIGSGTLQAATASQLDIEGPSCGRHLRLSRLYNYAQDPCFDAQSQTYISTKPFLQVRDMPVDAWKARLLFTEDYELAVNVERSDVDATFHVYEERNRIPSAFDRPFAKWQQAGNSGGSILREMIFQFDLGNSYYNHIVNDGDMGIIYTDGIGGNHRNGTGGFVIAPLADSEGGLRLDGEGRVNIGKKYDIPAGKDYALTVRGSVLAEEVEVKLFADWPDYVFADGYEMMSLEETENYIESNGHLPGVPSAEVVEEEGLALGEMNRILMEKVEELTLHMIELKKENDEIKEQLLKIAE